MKDELEILARSIVNMYDLKEKSNEEISMWREYFLSLNMPGSSDCSAHEKERLALVWRCFMTVPCGEFKRDPKKYLDFLLKETMNSKGK